MKENKFRTIVLIVLIAIFPWTIASLTSNLQLVEKANWIPDYLIQSEEGNNTVYSLDNNGISQNEIYPVNFNIWILAGIFTITILSLLVWRVRRKETKIKQIYIDEKLKSKDPVFILIVFGLIFICFFGPPLLLQFIVNYSFSAQYSPFQLEITRILIPIILFIVVIGSSLGMLYFFKSYKSSHIYPSDFEVADSDKTREVASIIDQTLSALKYGSGYRETIIKCYGELCNVLQRCGVPRSVCLTPREFEVLAVNQLHIESMYLHEATFLFEKARYSNGCVSKSEAKKTIQALNNLRNECFAKIKIN